MASRTEPVNLIVDNRVRGFCRKPYPGHPKGCPNWNKRATCPPQAPKIQDVLDLSKPVYCLINSFDLGAHVSRMKERHPKWSMRQARCLLYWQGTARKQLRGHINAFLEEHSDMVVLTCPEACGVDVGSTVKSLGIELDWPPQSTVYQIAVAGEPALGFKEKSHEFASVLTESHMVGNEVEPK